MTTCETFSEDKSSGRTCEESTLQILESMANSIFPYLKFTGEASTTKRAIPVLDCLMRIGKLEKGGEIFKEEEGHKPPGEVEDGMGSEEGVIYSFYRKPMASPFGIMSRSAMNQNVKVSTESSELRRRWKNTSCHVSKKEFESITKD